MNKFDGIICVGQTTWEGGPFQKAVVQLMTELSARHRVLFVNYPYTVKDLAQGLLGRAEVPVRNLLRPDESLDKKQLANGSETHTWQPPAMLPVNWLPDALHDRLVTWNANRLVKGLRKVMHRLGIERPLVINAFNPVFGLAMLHRLNECATVYYCFDEITLSPWMSRHGGRYERAYLPRVDAVITTSETLRRAKEPLQPNAYCVKNGVNFDLFNHAQHRTTQPSARPVIGYLGTADDRVDLPLVEHCVKTMPDVDFVFVGSVNEPAITRQLTAYPNVRFEPSRPVYELPPLLARMNAAMIPFVCNPHTYTIYPLKINEYLAAGLPVVATPFSLLDDFAGVVELAATPTAFATALRTALTDTGPERVAERVTMARGNSWARRSEEFETILHQLVRHPASTNS